MHNEDDPIESAYADYILAKYADVDYDSYFEDEDEEAILAEWESGVYDDD